MDERIDLLLRVIDEAFERKSWHGTNLRGSVRGLSVSEAVWRPAPGRHNAWEVMVHAAYWKYTVRRRLLGEKRGSFAYKGSNWFERSVPDGTLWKADLALLVATHRSLREAVVELDPRRLRTMTGKVPVVSLLTGIAAHDLYHAGQIQLLKRLQES